MCREGIVADLEALVAIFDMATATDREIRQELLNSSPKPSEVGGVSSQSEWVAGGSIREKPLSQNDTIA